MFISLSLSIIDFVLLLQVKEEQRGLRQRRLLGAELPGAAREQPGIQPLQRRGLLGKMKKIVNKWSLWGLNQRHFFSKWQQDLQCHLISIAIYNEKFRRTFSIIYLLNLKFTHLYNSLKTQQVPVVILISLLNFRLCHNRCETLLSVIIHLIHIYLFLFKNDFVFQIKYFFETFYS